MPHRTTWGSTGFVQKQKEVAGVGCHGTRPEPLLGFPKEDKAGQGSSLELAGLDNGSRLWAGGVVSSCLVPGPR